MADILLGIEMILSIVFGMAGFLIVWGFWPLALGPRSSPGVRSLSRAVLLMSLAVTIRVVYYGDSLISQEVRQSIGKAPPNIITSVILLFGAYYMLRVLYLTIPDAERKHWNLLTAAFYPRRWKRMFNRKLEEFIENAKGDEK